jgi:hypothetical protein
VAAGAGLCDGFARHWGLGMYEVIQAAASSDSITSLFALAIGYAVAGLCACGYRLYGTHFPSLRLLQMGAMPARFAAVPLLIFSAPFLIMRNTLRARSLERRRVEFVLLASAVAGLWSFMSGTVIVTMLQVLLSV